jgi:FlaG/FlaF family flagellin (archaellin)
MFSDGCARPREGGCQTFCPLAPELDPEPASPAVRALRFTCRIVALAGVVTTAAACGSQDHPFTLATAAAATSAMSATHQRPLATKLESSMDVSVNGEDVHFVMHVVNHTARKLEVTFPSGQTHDIAVVDAAGTEVWRWSSGQMFTQALRNQPLDPQASLSYSMHWKAPHAHGPLTAIATLTSSNYPIESRAIFVLP